jgi:signal recognition particle receptor subunit beta
MVQINFALREVNCKIVYYGPGLSGKTTNLEVIHAKAPAEFRGELTSIATEGDRTLFFDFLPLNLGTVAGMKTKFQLYTVPGQVFYNSTRKLVLQGVDGIVFVADSRRSKLDENVESLENLKENLREYGLKLETVPHVIQYNKRDLADILPIEELEKHLNPYKSPYIEAAAVTGQGVFPTLKKLAGMVLENLNRQQSSASVRHRKAEAVKHPVMATAGASREEAGAAAPSPGQASSPSRREQRRIEPGRPPEASSGSAGIVRESVAQGVKPVERRVPVKPKVAPRRTGPQGSAAAGPPGRPAPSAPKAGPGAPSRADAASKGARTRENAARAKKMKTWITAAVLLALASAGVYLYMTGMLKDFFG